jgi:hypothetical protein
MERSSAVQCTVLYIKIPSISAAQNVICSVQTSITIPYQHSIDIAVRHSGHSITHNIAQCRKDQLHIKVRNCVADRRRVRYSTVQHCTEAEFLNEIQTKSLEFSSLLFTVPSTALPWDFYFFKLMQPITVSAVQLLCIVRERGGEIWHCLRNLYRNLKTENSQDYAHKPQRTVLQSIGKEVRVL